MVEKKGNKWCVLHSKAEPGSPVGSIIKCFGTEQEAQAMHKAILISQAKEKDMADDIIYDEETLTAVKSGFANEADGRDIDKHAWDLVSLKVRERDDNKCSKCGKSRDKGILEVHHKNGNQKDNRLNNLVSLCVQCHNNQHVADRKKKKKDEYEVYKADQFRIDFMDVVPQSVTDNDYLVQKFERTPEGFLKGRAIITNVGVFTYMNPDGTTHRELRLPSEVFAGDAMNGYKMLPLTNNHPAEPVNVENVKALQVGHLGDDIRSDSLFVSAPILITDEMAVADAQAGKRGLSVGYKTDLEKQAGIFLGMPYDFIQRNIRPNHTALVDRGRAGDDARLKMDSMGAVSVQIIDQILNTGEVSMPDLKKIRLDGVEYEAESNVISAYTCAQKKVDELENSIQDTQKKNTDAEETWKKDKTALEAERDQFKDEAAKLKLDLEAAKKITPDQIEGKFKERMVVVDAAARAGVECKGELTEDSITALKKDIILKLFPSAKEKLEKADANYLDVRFDAALDYLEENTEAQTRADQLLGQDTLRHTKAKEDSAEAAYERMKQHNLDAHKAKEEK